MMSRQSRESHWKYSDSTGSTCPSNERSPDTSLRTVISSKVLEMAVPTDRSANAFGEGSSGEPDTLM